MPACTVAIPVFNQRAFIERAVRSALAQGVDGLEVVVVDNRSEDGTWEALQPFVRQGVRLHRNASNLGLFGNFNRCLELAGSPYLRLLAGDDVLASGSLRAELELMERNPRLAMLSTRGRLPGLPISGCCIRIGASTCSRTLQPCRGSTTNTSAS